MKGHFTFWIWGGEKNFKETPTIGISKFKALKECFKFKFKESKFYMTEDNVD